MLEQRPRVGAVVAQKQVQLKKNLITEPVLLKTSNGEN